MAEGDEDDLLRAVALRNASTILKVRRRAEQDLIDARDALERKTGELALSLAMMQATLDSATDGILVIGAQSRVSAMNGTFAAMWAVAEPVAGQIDEREHRTLLSAMASRFSDGAAFTARALAIEQQAPPASFDILELADGRFIERQSRPQLLQDGRVVGRVWRYRDVTEQRRDARERSRLLDSERSARQLAERMSALKDDFLATLSHELRTPLSAILGWVHILRRGKATGPDLQRGLDTIERNSRVQIQLIDDLLDMNRIASGKVRLDVQPVEPMAFVEAALETVRPAAHAKGITLESELDPAVSPIPGDPGRLQQVLGNLLSNAVKFTQPGGRILVRLAAAGAQVEITVADNGAGIRPDFVDHVFERFRQADASSTRRYGGLGLGLAIVKNLVELHGGTVSAHSEGEGKGATFRVCLPREAGRAAANEPALPGAPNVPMAGPFQPLDLAGLTVLVVDDDADGRELIARILAECGATVLTAPDAAMALATVRASRPDLMVSDIGMPDVDGFELLLRVRALGPGGGGNLPVIALTAFARPQDRQASLRAGFADHLTKPAKPHALIAAVAAAARRRP